MKNILFALALLCSIHIQVSYASTADEFYYDENQVATELSSLSVLESKVENHDVLNVEQAEQVKNFTALTGNAEPDGFRIISFISGCCCSLSGAAVASLYYYYKTGDTEMGKESLKYGIFGSAAPLILYVILILSNTSTNGGGLTFLGI
jgi:hypothetical protein